MAMTLMEKMADDLKVAMKSGDKLRLETLRTVRAAFLEKQVEKRPLGGMTPEDEIAVLIAASKKRKESITVFRENGRGDLADQEERELGIIQEYLPKQLSNQEIEVTIGNIIASLEANSSKDFGKVMSVAVKELRGRADGRFIQETVKKLLGD